jgi:hypothetical protein
MYTYVYTSKHTDMKFFNFMKIVIKYNPTKYYSRSLKTIAPGTLVVL